MSSYPRSPRIQKGAIVGLDPVNPLASVIVFQYNPETLTRTLTAQTSQDEGSPGEVLRLKAPPKEQIRADIEIDATDQLEAKDPVATSMGIHPQLAALEMLLYPKSGIVIANEVLKALGIIEVVPAAAPLTLFAWGMKRVLPVRITGFTITEEAFDPDLNPIHAKVDLSMDVLTYYDFGVIHPGGALSLAHQVMKESMATLNGTTALTGSPNGAVNLSPRA